MCFALLRYLNNSQSYRVTQIVHGIENLIRDVEFFAFGVMFYGIAEIGEPRVFVSVRSIDTDIRRKMYLYSACAR